MDLTFPRRWWPLVETRGDTRETEGLIEWICRWRDPNWGAIARDPDTWMPMKHISPHVNEIMSPAQDGVSFWLWVSFGPLPQRTVAYLYDLLHHCAQGVGNKRPNPLTCEGSA